MFQDVKFNWRGEKDLKTYRVNIEDDVTDMRGEDNRKRSHGVTASLKAGQIDFLRQGERTPVLQAAPANYIPGGWLPLVLGRLSDQPVILRTDSFIDYPDARTSDLLTVIVRPQPDAPRAGKDSDGARRCMSCLSNSAAAVRNRAGISDRTARSTASIISNRSARFAANKMTFHRISHTMSRCGPEDLHRDSRRVDDILDWHKTE